MRELNNLAASLLVVSILLIIAGCSSQQGNVPVSQPVVEPQPTIAWPELPQAGFPASDAIRITAAVDNWQTGSEAWQLASAGASINGDDLELLAPVGDLSWGIWRWGVFDPGIFPEQLQLELIPDLSQQYWLLLSNYTLDEWEIMGPYLPAVSTITLDPATTYVSPSGYAYVALVVHDGDSLTVERLNLVAEEDVNPPLAPQDVNITQVGNDSLRLNWTANTEPDLSKYNIYTGPLPGFQMGDAGVELIDSATMLETTSLISGLDAETTYHFRMSAVDAALSESPLSNVATATTVVAPEWPAPTNVTLDDVSGGWAQISWSLAQPIELDGVDVYLGPAPDFLLTDPGVVKKNTFKITELNYLITGLTAETEYYCRLQATYLGFHKSDLTETLTFSTTSSIPPVPDFSMNPAIIKAGIPIDFDPSLTQDSDNDLSELVFYWDFDNDGTDDETTVGPDVVQHTFANRGPVTVKLTASDGTPVPVTKDITVLWNYDPVTLGELSGLPGVSIASDSDVASSRLAVLICASPYHYVAYFNGADWQSTRVDVPQPLIWDVALTSSGPAVLTALLNDGAGVLDWYVHELIGSNWVEQAHDQASADDVQGGTLAIAPNDRISALINVSETAGYNVNYWAYLFHQQADTTFKSSNNKIGFSSSGSYTWEPSDLLRTDSTTYAVLCDSEPGSPTFMVWNMTDASDSTDTHQTYASLVTDLISCADPDDETRVHWAALNDAGRIYYGDNYGTANGGSQYFDAPDATSLLGLGVAGDNAGELCWSAEAANGVQYIRGWDSTVGGGAVEYASGIGMAAGGHGTCFKVGPDLGIYAIADEERDGQGIGRFISGGAVDFSEMVYAPQGTTHTKESSQALLFADGSLLTLNEMAYPSALGGFATTPGETPTITEYGVDNWGVPDAACITDVAGEFFVGSYTDAAGLLLTRYNLGTATGNVEVELTGTSLAQLAFEPGDSETALFYATNGDTDLAYRTWNGASWGSEQVLAAGLATLQAIDVAGGGGEWAVVYLTSGDDLNYLHTDGTWQAAELLSSAPLNLAAGISVELNSGLDACFAVERNDGAPGIYLGTRPAGDTVSWEKLADTTGTATLLTRAFYVTNPPLVVYVERQLPLKNSTLHVLEYQAAAWLDTEMIFNILGEPYGHTVDATGNIILSGYSQAFSTHRGVGIVLYP